MAGPSLPLIAFLFVSTFSFSFSHAFLNFLTIFLFSLIPFTVSSPSNFFTHYLYHLIRPPCRRQRVRVLLTVKEKRLADDPLVKVVGGEAPHFELDHFEKEEEGRDPGSECPSLVNQWYNTHIHFLVVSDDYSPPPLGYVRLSFGLRDSKVSWAPLASFIPNLDILQGTALLVPILFEFRSSTSLGWKKWVDTKLSDMGFMKALQQVSVSKAIVSSWCFSNYRDLFNLCHLIRRWCSTAHTFFLSCGEITVTLEDVANQLLLPILGDIDSNTLSF